jgi:hypothetical protein
VSVRAPESAGLGSAVAAVAAACLVTILASLASIAWSAIRQPNCFVCNGPESDDYLEPECSHL